MKKLPKSIKLADHFTMACSQYLHLNKLDSSKAAIDQNLSFPSTKDEKWKNCSVSVLSNNHFQYCQANSVFSKDANFNDKIKSLAKKLRHHVQKLKTNDLQSKHYDKTADKLWKKWFDHLDCLDCIENPLLKPTANVIVVLEDKVYGVFIDNRVSNIDNKTNKNIDLSLNTDISCDHDKSFDDHGTDQPFYSFNNNFNHTHYKLQINCSIQKPVYIYHYYCDDYQTNVLSQPKLSIVLDHSAKCEIYHSHIFLQSYQDHNYYRFVNSSTEIQLRSNTNLSYISMLHSPCYEKSCDYNLYIGSIRVKVEDHSVFKCFSANQSTKLLRLNLCVLLLGKASYALVNSANVCNRNLDLQFQLIHLNALSKSDQYYKTVCLDKSIGVINGKIHILNQAVESDANLLIKNLLLSEQAKVYTKPELISDCDDVKASHGTTVSMLKKSEIWYLTSRGIKPEAAQTLLVLGFIKDLIGKWPNIQEDPIWKSSLSLLKQYNHPD